MYSFVTFPQTGRKSFIDVLDYMAINKALESDQPFKIFVLEIPSLKRFTSIATAIRIDAKTVRLTWKINDDDDTNRKNDMDVGDLFLIWEKAQDTMVRDPSIMYWIGAGKTENDKEFATWSTLAT
jgi:hypothetical protein